MAHSIRKALLRTIDFVDSAYLKAMGTRTVAPASIRNYVRAERGRIDTYVGEASEFLAYARLLCGLKTSDRVLDIGCAGGRFLSSLIAPPVHFEGDYCGFDVNRQTIEWAKRAFSTQYARSEFIFADLYNALYHPEGTLRATEYSFPRESSSMDYVHCCSLFTHVDPRTAAHYLAEIARVLRPGKRGLATALLYEDRPERHLLLDQLKGPIADVFAQPWHEAEGYAVADPECPEKLIAYEETVFRRMVGRAGLNVVAVYPGHWRTKDNFLSVQDIIVFEAARVS